MTRDHLGALLRVVSSEDGLHLSQRHVELPQLVDHLCGRDLLGRVVAVTRDGSTVSGSRSLAAW